jgi:type I restriction enzyme R subunit
MSKFIETHLEEAILELLDELNWKVEQGPEIGPEGARPEREDYRQVVLTKRLRATLQRLNPGLPTEALEDAERRVVNLPNLHPTAGENSRVFHRLLTEGVDVEFRNKEGRLVGDKAWLVDFDEVGNNDFVAVNQFTVQEDKRPRRADVVLFINGLPLVLMELKNPADENATTRKAFEQLQTYKEEIPSLFACNEIVVLSDGIEAKAGTFLSPWERFMPWSTVEGEDLAAGGQPQIETLVAGMLAPERLLDLVRNFIVMNEERGEITKKLAAYHQYHAVNRALEEAVKAVGPEGDRRIGVVWHTQGSGKSLTMAFFAGKIIAHPAMRNPTLVVITDRNDLDDQLFDTFVEAQALLRQRPQQAESREHLKELLRVASGGVVFTTAQKFFPEQRGEQYEQLSDRQNIIVIADEAHRSQYGFIEGFARHMRDALPRASFIGFTGTPIELDDRNTRQVFGNDISVYDIERAIQDEVTVPIYYEARLAKIDIAEAELPRIDAEFEEITEEEEEQIRERLKSKWARLEAAAGHPKRVHMLAQDILDHFDARQGALEGKGMVVAMSRRIAVDLYNEIVALRPGWHNPDDHKGCIKIVMTGSASDPPDWQAHIRTKTQRKEIENRFKDPNDALQVVIVRDMWLTGFDVPPLHTMYIDKPMKGHTLMQAIARVNRVFRDKPGGLVVDYIGVAEALKEALATYTASGGKGEAAVDQRAAVAVMMEKYEVVQTMFHGFDWPGYFQGSKAEQLRVLAQAMEHILGLEDGKARYLQHIAELSKAFALSVTQPETKVIRDDLGFFQAVRAGIIKTTRAQEVFGGNGDLDHAIRQIVTEAVTPEGVMDIFQAAGLPKPDISILSENFLQGVKNMPQKHLAVELLQKLLNDEIKARARRNLVQSRSFAEMLESTIRRYQARTIEAAQVIIELIALAKEIKEADKRGEELGLSEEEKAFYDALAANESAREVMGDEKLSVIAREVLNIVRNNVTIDWTVRESVRANLRRLVKRVLRKYGYPPDMQEAATLTVIKQAELWAEGWGVG